MITISHFFKKLKNNIYIFKNIMLYIYIIYLFYINNNYLNFQQKQ